MLERVCRMSKWDICLSVNLRELVVYVHQQDWSGPDDCKHPLIKKQWYQSLLVHGSFYINQILTERFNFFLDERKLHQSKECVDTNIQHSEWADFEGLLFIMFMCSPHICDYNAKHKNTSAGCFFFFLCRLIKHFRWCLGVGAYSHDTMTNPCSK